MKKIKTKNKSDFERMLLRKKQFKKVFDSITQFPPRTKVTRLCNIDRGRDGVIFYKYSEPDVPWVLIYTTPNARWPRRSEVHVQK